MKLSELVAVVVANTNRKDKTDVIKQGVNFGLRDVIQKAEWRFLVQEVDLGIVAGDSSVGLPIPGATITDDDGNVVAQNGVAQIRKVRLLDASNTSLCQVLLYLTQSEVQDRWPNLMANSQGRPTVCYRQGDQLTFLPPSSGTYTLRVTYDALCNDLVSDDDQTPSTVIDNAVAAYATMYTYQSFQSYTDAQYWRGVYLEAVKTAVLSDRRVAGRNQTLGSGMVGPSDSGDPYENKYTRV